MVFTSEVSAVVNTVLERLLGFFWQIDIAANEGVLEAKFADFPFRNFCAILVEQGDFGRDFWLSNGASVVGLIDAEDTDGKARFGARIDVDQLKVWVIDVVRWLATHEEHA